MDKEPIEDHPHDAEITPEPAVAVATVQHEVAEEGEQT